jgi:hypothetical protein
VVWRLESELMPLRLAPRVVKMAGTLYQLARLSSFFSCFVENIAPTRLLATNMKLLLVNLSMVVLLLENMREMEE